MFKKQQVNSALAKGMRGLVILVLLPGLIPTGVPVQAQQDSGQPDTLAATASKSYLPLIRNGGSLPLMTGIMPGWPDAETINNVMKPLDKWVTGVTGGRSTSIFGTFLTLNLRSNEVKANVEVPLTLAWEAGYTPFINLPAMNIKGHTAKYVAESAEYETLITQWAESYKNYAAGGKRFAYIAPLQEMNGEWVEYGKDPAGYKAAYAKFQRIFHDKVKVPRQSVKWVFAPNGWTNPKYPMFEEYYPGHSKVDVVAISAYNFGYCDGGSWKEPHIIYNNPTFDQGFYLDRMRALAPSKPIFIAQTASSSYRNPGVKNAAEKERWMRDAYKFLANQPNVKAVIYFNIFKVCDWEIFKNGVGNPGYKDGIRANGYRYISPTELMNTDHTVP